MEAMCARDKFQHSFVGGTLTVL